MYMYCVSLDLQRKIHFIWNTVSLVTFLVGFSELLLCWLVQWVLTTLVACVLWGMIIFVLISVITLSTFCLFFGLCLWLLFLFLSLLLFLLGLELWPYFLPFLRGPSVLLFSGLSSVPTLQPVTSPVSSSRLIRPCGPFPCVCLCPPQLWRSSGTHHRWRCVCPWCGCQVPSWCWTLSHTLCTWSTSPALPLLWPSPSFTCFVSSFLPYVSGSAASACQAGVHHVSVYHVPPNLQLWEKRHDK